MSSSQPNLGQPTGGLTSPNAKPASAPSSSSSMLRLGSGAGQNGTESPGRARSPVTSKSSYAGDFWNVFFNSKTALAEAFRKDPKLRANTPAYILGRMNEGEPDFITQWVNENVKHIHYFSYRNRIPRPLSNGMDHDAGWGCMIRTGQMMLCEALRRALPDAAARHTQHLFQDTPTAPFGLHAMTDAGAKACIPVGNWFSPTALAHTVRRLVTESPITAPCLGVVIGNDGAVKRDEVSAEFVEGRPVLVLIPIMAARDKIPPDVQRAVLKMFELPCTLGIVGGRPKHSLYFVGAQSENVFFLDPHTVQSAFTSPDTVGNAAGVRGTMHASEMDPSMVLCFYLSRNLDLDEWERAFAEVINPMTEYPLFSILRRKSKAAAAPAHQSNAAASPGSVPPGAAKATEPAVSPKPSSSPPPIADEAVDDCDYDSDVEIEMASAGQNSGALASAPTSVVGAPNDPQLSSESSSRDREIRTV
jgi:cysteine protease ATG4